VTYSLASTAVAKSVIWSRFAIGITWLLIVMFPCGWMAWMDGMGMYIIGSAARVPLVTRYNDALNGSSVGVKMLGL